MVWLLCVLACFSLGLSCMGLSALPGLDYFFSHVREFFNSNLFKYFLKHFFFLFFFWNPHNSNVGEFNVVLEVSETVFIAFHPFFFFILLLAVILTILSSRSLIRSSASVILVLIPSSVFFISVIMLFITDYLFFSSSHSLLNISGIFLIFASILFLRSWIIFTIITLNYFSGLSIFSSLIWSCGFLPFSCVCNVFLCHLISSNLLCLWSPFCRLQGHSSSFFCCLPPGGWDWSRALCRLPCGRDW